MATYKYITVKEEAEKAARYIDNYLDLLIEQDELPLLALDVETYSNDILDGAPRPIRVNNWYQGMPKTIQLGLDPKIRYVQFIIDVEILNDREWFASVFRPIFDKAYILGQNLKYEYQYLYTHFGIRLKNMRDLMLMSQVLNAGDKLTSKGAQRKHGLAALYREYIPLSVFQGRTGKFFDEYDLLKETNQKSCWRGLLTEEQLSYAADDVRLVFDLLDYLMEEITKFSNKWEKQNKPDQTIYRAIKLECNLIPVYAMMELRGVYFDKKHHECDVIPFLEARASEAEKEVAKYFSKEVIVAKGRAKNKTYETVIQALNMNSPKQLKEALSSVGIQLPEVKPTEAKTLQKFVGEHPSVAWIIRYKKASSLLSKFGQKLLDLLSFDNKLYPSWFQIGADDNAIDTGRSSCKDPNLQQIPNREDDVLSQWGTSLAELFRRTFIALLGWCIVDSDFSQIEPCIQAELNNETIQIEAFQQAFREGKSLDTHSLTAKTALKLDFMPDKHNPAHKKYRQIGKILNLGLSYGMGAKKLAIQITEATGEYCSKEQAQDYIDSYFNGLPGTSFKKKFIERETRKSVEGAETLAVCAGRKPMLVRYTSMGRPRRWCLTPEQERMARDPSTVHLLSKWADDGKWSNEYNSRISKVAREAYNFEIQGTCADILKQALIYIQDTFTEQGFDFLNEGIIMVVHDEVVATVKEEHAESAKEIITSCMIRAAKEVLKQVPVSVDCKVGRNWEECH